MRINDATLKSDGDYLSLAQNATQNPSTLAWTANDNARDAYLIEMVDSNSNQGYITVKRSPATSGIISWAEILRVNFDGTIILNSAFVLPPTAPASGQAKLYLDDFLGRLMAKFKTSSETVNLLQSSGFGRIWKQATASFPAGAKLWDVVIRPSSTGYIEKEIRIDIESLGTGTAAPTKQIIGNYVGYLYQIGDDSKFQFEIPHDWVGGDLELYAHLYVNENYATNNGYINWELKYSCTPEDGGEPLDAPTDSGTLASGDFQIPATAKHLMEAGPVTIPEADIAEGDIVGVTFKRIANTGGHSAPTAHPVIIGIELEYHASKLL
jgi:hypothetical protein